MLVCIGFNNEGRACTIVYSVFEDFCVSVVAVIRVRPVQLYLLDSCGSGEVCGNPWSGLVALKLNLARNEVANLVGSGNCSDFDLLLLKLLHPRKYGRRSVDVRAREVRYRTADRS